MTPANTATGCRDPHSGLTCVLTPPQRVVRTTKRHDAYDHYARFAPDGVWTTEQALEVIVTALQEAAETCLACIDGLCADCTDYTTRVDHAGDVDAATRYYALDEIDQRCRRREHPGEMSTLRVESQ